MQKIKAKFYKVPIYVLGINRDGSPDIEGTNALTKVLLDIAIWFHQFFNEIFDLEYNFPIEFDDYNYNLFIKMVENREHSDEQIK